MVTRTAFFNLFLSLGLSLSFSSATAHAWSKQGHRVVMMIASENLTPIAKKKIAYLLNSKTASDIGSQSDMRDAAKSGTHIELADVANWADEIRSDKRYDLIKNLHFADLPHSTSDYRTVDKKYLAPEGDVVVAIEALSTFLQKNDVKALDQVKAFRDLQASGIQITRLTALKLFSHFIGDLVQPLHLGYVEDQGGNKMRVDVMGVPGNLHALWDDLLNNQEKYSSTEYAQFLIRQLSAEQKMRWLKEDLFSTIAHTLLLRDRLYKFPDGLKTDPVKPGEPPKTIDPNVPSIPEISYLYFYEMQPVLNEQLTRGGLLAATMLNSIFAAQK